MKNSIIDKKNHIIHLARIIIETDTPLLLNSGKEGLVIDNIIVQDANGLPYIPGTSLAGVLRHEIIDHSIISSEKTNDLFGFQTKTEGEGSRINFSSASLLADDGKTVLDGLRNIDFSPTVNEKDNYYSYFNRLPQRDHVRINHKGVAENNGKFEEQVIYKGTRFVFEIELRGNNDDSKYWEHILDIIASPNFRIGGGTRNGFGKLKIISCQTCLFDLTLKEGLSSYLKKNSSLNSDVHHLKPYKEKDIKSNKWIHYQIELHPENFFLFGAGHPDKDADMSPKLERYFKWDKNDANPVLSEEQILIPATSIKGALSHRLAFHYNSINESTPFKQTKIDFSDLDIDALLERQSLNLQIENLEYPSNSAKWLELENSIGQSFTLDSLKKNSNEWNTWEEKLNREVTNAKKQLFPVGEGNPAVKSLFGYPKDDNEKDKQTGSRGKVILSDIYESRQQEKEKILDHVAIDRFTSGAMDTALYQEKVVNLNTLLLNIYVHKSAIEDLNIKEAFELTLKDLITGHLTLGGNTQKGNGSFSGKIIKPQNSERI